MTTTAYRDGECSEHDQETLPEPPDFVTTRWRRYKINKRSTAETSGVNLKQGDTLPEDANFVIVSSKLVRAPGNSFDFIDVVAVKDKLWTA